MVPQRPCTKHVHDDEGFRLVTILAHDLRSPLTHSEAALFCSSSAPSRKGTRRSSTVFRQSCR